MRLNYGQRRRNEVEGVFGSGKRKYSLRLIMAQLPKAAVTSITLSFQAVCAEKIPRLLHPLFVTIFASTCYWLSPDSFWVVLRNTCLLEAAKSPVTADRFCELPVLGLWLHSRRPQYSCSGVLKFAKTKTLRACPCSTKKKISSHSVVLPERKSA